MSDEKLSIKAIYDATTYTGETLKDWRAEWSRLAEEEKEWYRVETAKGMAKS